MTDSPETVIEGDQNLPSVGSEAAEFDITEVATVEKQTVVVEAVEGISNNTDTCSDDERDLILLKNASFSEHDFATPGPSKVIGLKTSRLQGRSRSVRDIVNSIVGDVITDSNGSEETNEVSQIDFVFTSSDDLQNIQVNAPKTVNLKSDDTGPCFYTVKPPFVTEPLNPKLLPKAFDGLPLLGRIEDKMQLPKLKKMKLKEFVGGGLTDEEFKKLESYCSPENLKKGIELNFQTEVPNFAESNEYALTTPSFDSNKSTLHTVRKHRVRLQLDRSGSYSRRLKYRGLRINPLSERDEEDMSFHGPEEELTPNKDLLYSVRIYRPFSAPPKRPDLTDPRLTFYRHPLMSREMCLLGRQRLTAFRDSITCINDVGLRVDVSDNPNEKFAAHSKELFPSGFFFINNVFYSDSRGSCADLTAPVREWARRRGIGHFQLRNMHDWTFDQLTVKLGHPEVYVHQGTCEHLFTISSVRLLNAGDPLNARLYPAPTATCRSHIVYCTTCAEFSCRWLVKGCERVPFDPAYFCDTCFETYLYKDGKKIGNFKAYRFMYNEMCVGVS